MSAKGIESVLSRAMSDSAFADLLFVDAENALAGFELTTDEIAGFKSMSRSDFDALSMLAPEERKSFSVLSRDAGSGAATGKRMHKPIL